MSNANSSQTTEHIEFKGKYGPLLDEIAIREFKDKNVMTPLYKGAFKSCKENGICSEKDANAYKDFIWRSAITIGTGVLLSIPATILYFKFNPRLVENKENIRKMFSIYLSIPITFTVGSVAYRYMRTRRQLDSKYTPFYLKSKGLL